MVIRRYSQKPLLVHKDVFLFVVLGWFLVLIITTMIQAVRVAYFAEGADADEARAAGADIVGGLELIEEIASTVPLVSNF